MITNHVRLSGTMFEVKNLALSDHEILQVATFVYNGGHSHIRLLVLPATKLSLCNNLACIVVGTLHNDHINVEALEKL